MFKFTFFWQRKQLLPVLDMPFYGLCEHEELGTCTYLLVLFWLEDNVVYFLSLSPSLSYLSHVESFFLSFIWQEVRGTHWRKPNLSIFPWVHWGSALMHWQRIVHMFLFVILSWQDCLRIHLEVRFTWMCSLFIFSILDWNSSFEQKIL